MQTVQYIPGIVPGGNPHTLPGSAPDIDAVVSAEITRIPNALAAHADSGVAAAHGNGVNPVAHAGATVDAHVFTQPANHTLTPDVAKGGAITNALGEDGGGNLETAGAAKVAMATCISAHGGGAVDAHTVNQPNNHIQAAIVAALADHAAAAIAAALAAHTGATPVVAAGAVNRLTKRTFTIANPTALGDLLTLNYHAVGERVLVS